MTPFQFVRRSLTESFTARAMSLFNVVSGATAVLTLVGAAVVVRFDLMPGYAAASIVVALILTWTLAGAYRSHVEDELTHARAVDEISLERATLSAELADVQTERLRLADENRRLEAEIVRVRPKVAYRFEGVENLTFLDSTGDGYEGGVVDMKSVRDVRMRNVDGSLGSGTDESKS